jgi:hypothetical protein
MSNATNFSEFYQENKKLVREYIETRVELLKLKSVRSLSQVLSLMIILFITSALLLFVMLFLGMSFAWWIARLTDSNAIGFLSAAGLFTLLVMIVIALRKPLFRTPLIKMFISEAMKDELESEEEE